MGTKQNPGEFDCYHKAAPDEPMFILLARDSGAPELVERWANKREIDIQEGRRPLTDLRVVEEARKCALDMRNWFHRTRLA